MFTQNFYIPIRGISYQNKLNIIRELLSARPSSRKDIAERCSLSEVTVGKIASALCSHGLLNSEKLPVGRGRHTDFFTPSSSICALVIKVRDKSLHATLFDLSENVIFELFRPINSSLSYEDSIASFCREISSHLTLINDIFILRTALLFESDEDAKIAQMIAEKLGTLSEVDACLEYNGARARALSRIYPDSILLVLEIEERISLSLICDGKSLPKSKLMPQQIPSNDPNHLIEQLSALLPPIFNAVFPDMIILESKKILADKCFRDTLTQRLACKMNLPAENMPPIEADRDADFSDLDALAVLRDKISLCLANDQSVSIKNTKRT